MRIGYLFDRNFSCAGGIGTHDAVLAYPWTKLFICAWIDQHAITRHTLFLKKPSLEKY